VTGEFHKALYVLDVGSNQALKKGKQWTSKQIEKKTKEQHFFKKKFVAMIKEN